MKWFFSAFLNRPDLLIQTIMGINIGMYLFSLLLGLGIRGAMNSPLSLFSPSGRILQFIGATGSLMVHGFQGWWTLVAANYLHGSILHIFFNLLVFWQVSPLVVREYGASRTIVIYSVSGILGFVVSVWAGVPSTIGASGAVCGLMGALIYYGKSRGGLFGEMIYKQIGGWVLGLFVLGFFFRGTGINNWAHAGGLLGGVISGLWLGYADRLKETPFHRLLAKILAIITVAALVWAVMRGLLLYFP